MKRIAALLLIALFLTGNVVSYADEPKLLSLHDAEAQINLIIENINDMRQDTDEKSWRYAVTDLDHNGRLEFLAASEHDQNHSTTLAAWEISKDLGTLKSCSIDLPADESFPDIISSSADTFYDEQNGLWNYLFYDNIVLSDKEAYAIKCSVTLDRGSISYTQYAIEHIQVSNITYTDNEGTPISQEAYDSAGIDAFHDMPRSSTNLDWFTYADAVPERIRDSYAVFCGEKAPTQVIPEPTPTPTPVPTPDPNILLMITKNPTNVYCHEGESAYFLATSNVWTSLRWTFITPDGETFSIDEMNEMFQTIAFYGDDSPTLTVDYVGDVLDGYGVYCTFYYYGQIARSSIAYLIINPWPWEMP